MNKNTYSMILLCMIAVSFLLTVIMFVNTGIAVYKLETIELDQSNDRLPLASLLGAAFTALAVWGGFIFIEGAISSVGFFCALINTKIAQNIIIQRISKAFLCFYSAILILIAGMLVWFVVTVF